MKLASIAALGMFGLLALNACSASVQEEDQAAEEVKKKVKPKAGNGAFDLDNPAWSTTGVLGTYAVSNRPIKPSERLELVPGTYSFATNGGSGDLGGGIHQAPQSVNFSITAGQIEARKPSALRVRFSKPVTLGGNQVRWGSPGYETGWADEYGPWRTQANGTTVFAVEGKMRVLQAADPAAQDFTLASGELKEIVLPTTTVNLSIDAYDAQYPTPPQCTAATIFAGATQRSELIRKLDGSPNATFVVPAGPKAPVTIDTYGFLTTLPTSTSTIAVTLNRLEIDDLDVSTVNGTKTYKGTFKIERKDGSSWKASSCNNGLPTHSGVDLVDGTYRITTSAWTPSGTQTSVEEVSFP